MEELVKQVSFRTRKTGRQGIGSRRVAILDEEGSQFAVKSRKDALQRRVKKSMMLR